MHDDRISPVVGCRLCSLAEHSCMSLTIWSSASGGPQAVFLLIEGLLGIFSGRSMPLSHLALLEREPSISMAPADLALGRNEANTGTSPGLAADIRVSVSFPT